MTAPRPILFCHIPKTAGTALRVALERALPSDRIVRDYGDKSSFTTSDIEQRLHESPYEWDLLCGHFPMSKHGKRFAPHQAVTFLRRPLQQLVSHYEHFCRRNDYTGTLHEFSGATHGAGVQGRLLGGLPVQLFGLVGITESIEESAAAFASAFGLSLDIPRWNENPDKVGENYSIQIHDFPEEVQARLQRDFWIYVQARRTLQERLKHPGPHWTHGAITDTNGRQLSGLAFRPSTRESFIPIRVMVNGHEVALTCSGRDSTSLRIFDWSTYPKSGFEIRLSQPLKEGDVVDLYCADSDQWLDSIIWHGPSAKSPPWTPAPLKHRPV